MRKSLKILAIIILLVITILINYFQKEASKKFDDGNIDAPVIENENISIEFKEIPEDNETRKYICSSDFYNCQDFSTRAEAQKVLEFCRETTLKRDIHELDRDNNDIVCETLP